MDPRRFLFLLGALWLGGCAAPVEAPTSNVELTGTLVHSEHQMADVDCGISVFGHYVGTSLRLSVTGPETRFAVIGGNLYREGDLLESRQLRVFKIHNYGVELVPLDPLDEKQ